MMPTIGEFVFWFFLSAGVSLFWLPFVVFVCVKMGRTGWLLAERHFRLRFPEEKDKGF